MFKFADRNTMTYFETSCKTGENVTDLFEQIASNLVHRYDPKIVKYFLLFIFLLFLYFLAQLSSTSTRSFRLSS